MTNKYTNIKKIFYTTNQTCDGCGIQQKKVEWCEAAFIYSVNIICYDLFCMNCGSELYMKVKYTNIAE